jgi:hypothetical protein
MARTGVTLADVSAAADQLVAAGERPSTERVRLALGRGSPNTIGPLLEQWWTHLSERLSRRLSIPGLPAPVAAAFAEAWERALAAGQAHAEAQVAPERAAVAAVLAAAEETLAQHRAHLAALEGQVREAQAATQGLQTALSISERRAVELQRELEAQSVAAQVLAQQSDAAEARARDAAAAAEADRTAAARERESLQSLLRQVEDRAYSEVDRVRQELKAIKAQLATAAREHAGALRASEQARRGVQTELARAGRTIASLEARLARADHKKPPGSKPGRKTTARPVKRSAGIAVER